MTPTECPRCEAERCAQYTRVAANVGLVLAILFGACLCCTVTAEAMNPFRGESGEPPIDCVRPLGWLALLVAAILCLCAAAWHLARRAATPLAAPPPGPIAHCREGPPPPCSRHPWRATDDAPALTAARSEASPSDGESGEPPMSRGERAARTFFAVVVAVLILLVAAVLAMPTLD